MSEISAEIVKLISKNCFSRDNPNKWFVNNHSKIALIIS